MARHMFRHLAASLPPADCQQLVFARLEDMGYQLDETRLAADKNDIIGNGVLSGRESDIVSSKYNFRHKNNDGRSVVVHRHPGTQPGLRASDKIVFHTHDLRGQPGHLTTTVKEFLAQPHPHPVRSLLRRAATALVR